MGLVKEKMKCSICGKKIKDDGNNQYEDHLMWHDRND